MNRIWAIPRRDAEHPRPAQIIDRRTCALYSPHRTGNLAAGCRDVFQTWGRCRGTTCGIAGIGGKCGRRCRSTFSFSERDCLWAQQQGHQVRDQKGQRRM